MSRPRMCCGLSTTGPMFRHQLPMEATFTSSPITAFCCLDVRTGVVSPAISDGQIFIRTKNFLYAIGALNKR